MQSSRFLACILFGSMVSLSSIVSAQQIVSGDLKSDLKSFVETPAISGYERDLARQIADELRALNPAFDNMGDVIVNVGSGSPHRLLVAPIDEPGYVISDITPDGYVRVQRLPQGGALPQFNRLQSAQPVKVWTSKGTWIDGSVAGLSVHLQPGRQNAPNTEDIDQMFVDVGASNSKQVRDVGVDVLNPVAINRHFYEMGFGRWTAPAIGDRFGAAALVELLRHLDKSKLSGTLTAAFVTQQWTGARGLERVLESNRADEVIYVGRLMRSAAPATNAATPPPRATQLPHSGVVFASEEAQPRANPLTADLQRLASSNHIALRSDYSAPLIPRGYSTPPPTPASFVHLAVPIAWATTPAETIDASDLTQLVSLLETYLQSSASPETIAAAAPLPEPAAPAKPASAPTADAILKQLIETYGVSEHETPVRMAVQNLLPPWAKPETDDAGNLIVRWGDSSKAPHEVIVAHMDEIGYVVREITADGKLELDNKGGGLHYFFAGHAGLIHASTGMRPGVIELPEGWEAPNYQWPRDIRTGARMDVGASNTAEVAQLGIKVGDYITIPKAYRTLLGTKVSARSLDDRVGCAALVAAAWSLGPNLANRNITFVWSTGEELGLVGAGKFGERMAREQRAPEYVFAIDTFVSADSPLELPRFGDAKLGEGFVVRAIDNSNIVPRDLVSKVVGIAESSHIPVQYGITGGGNDGSAFLRYGSIDVALGWPLRYSHSPAEVIDTRDLDALSHIITEVARKW